MMPKVDPHKLGSVRMWEFGLRFLFGGLIAAVAGVVGRFSGPVVGGLLLAFPAILPASLTLISKHDGRRDASHDALGAIAGAVGLATFGVSVWFLAPKLHAVAILIGLAAWALVSVALWAVFLSRVPGR